ncbi:Os05g0371150 [Oryza sativa Japonica Group]|uniref:Os05g0371150 protein n=1 Tax=Oryza sativa subsp. japonica TaxID=39947 RepID=A0A0P0WLT0_ORYSJ|nr:Os05g0371150 [Oryza sativa Japonica Group]
MIPPRYHAMIPRYHDTTRVPCRYHPGTMPIPEVPCYGTTERQRWPVEHLANHTRGHQALATNGVDTVIVAEPHEQSSPAKAQLDIAPTNGMASGLLAHARKVSLLATPVEFSQPHCCLA